MGEIGGTATIRAQGDVTFTSGQFGTFLTSTHNGGGQQPPADPGLLVVEGHATLTNLGLALSTGYGVSVASGGVVTMAPDTWFAADYGTALIIQPGGTLEVAGDGDYHQGFAVAGQPLSLLTNNGLLTKTAGAGTSVVDATYAGSGQAAVLSGTLALPDNQQVRASVSPGTSLATGRCEGVGPAASRRSTRRRTLSAWRSRCRAPTPAPPPCTSRSSGRSPRPSTRPASATRCWPMPTAGRRPGRPGHHHPALLPGRRDGHAARPRSRSGHDRRRHGRDAPDCVNGAPPGAPYCVEGAGRPAPRRTRSSRCSPPRPPAGASGAACRWEPVRRRPRPSGSTARRPLPSTARSSRSAGPHRRRAAPGRPRRTASSATASSQLRRPARRRSIKNSGPGEHTFKVAAVNAVGQSASALGRRSSSTSSPSRVR